MPAILKLKQLTKVTEAELRPITRRGSKGRSGILQETSEGEGMVFQASQSGRKVKKKGSPVSRTDQVDEFFEN